MLKKIKKAPVTIFLLIILGGGLFALYYQGFFARMWHRHHVSVPQNIRFGVVDLNRVRLEAECFKKLRSYIEDRYSEANKIIFNSENELRAEYKLLREREKRSEKTNNKELLKKRQAFEKKVGEIEQMVQQKKNALNEKFTEISGRIEKKLLEIISHFAKDSGLDAIVNQSMGDEVPIVLYAAPSLDLTDAVIDALNKAKDELDLPK